MKFTFTPEAAALVGERSFSTKYGARNMRRFIQRNVEDKLASDVISARGNITAATLGVRDGELALDAV